MREAPGEHLGPRLDRLAFGGAQSVQVFLQQPANAFLGCAPVAAFGARGARLLIVGLAPGLHGANASGRPFTGDASGDLLFAALRDETWADLGPDALRRYESLVAIWEGMPFPEPHLHINMLGTRRSHAGKGYGRRILETVQAASRRPPASRGVSLSTEDPANVRLYEHCGYRVLQHARVTASLETWIMFRENGPPAPERA